MMSRMCARVMTPFALLALLTAGDARGLNSSDAASAGQSGATTSVDALERLGLYFEPNRGQVEGVVATEEVRFVSRGPGYQLFLGEREATLALRAGTRTEGGEAAPSAVRLRLSQSNPSPQIEAEAPLDGRVHYFVGRDPASWHTGVPTYARVRYREVYPGTDLVFYGNPGQLEYDFVLSPGADPGAIRLVFDDAEEMLLDAEGNLRLRLPGGEVLQRAPIAYQSSADGRQRVAAAFAIEEDGSVGFRLGGWDRGRTLVIDPVLEFATYLGGAHHEHGRGVAVDESGVYVAGFTNGLDLPGASTLGPGGELNLHVLVAKLTPDGSSLVWATYVGGSEVPEPLTGLFAKASAVGIAVDRWGAATVVGSTNAIDLPTTPGAFQREYQGGADDAIALRLSADGSRLEYLTYLGGSGGVFLGYEAASDFARHVDVDDAGNALIAGYTDSPDDFPTTPGSYRPEMPDPDGSVWVAKLSADGSTLLYSTYLASRFLGQTVIHGLRVDAAGSAILAGYTDGAMWPLENALQTVRGAGSDCVVAKLAPDGGSLIFSTLLGGNHEDACFALDVDGSGNIYVGGTTGSTDLPVVDAFEPDPSAAVEGDGYLAVFEPDGSAISYASYMGGPNVHRVAVDGAGQIHVAGPGGAGFPLLDPLPYQGATGSFVAKFEPGAQALRYATFLSGVFFQDLALGPDGSAYLVGDWNWGTGYMLTTTEGAYQPQHGGLSDAFVLRIVDREEPADLRVTQSISPSPALAGDAVSYDMTVTNDGPGAASGVVLRQVLPPQVVLASMPVGCSETGGELSCDLGDLASGANVARSLSVVPAEPGVLASTVRVFSNSFDPDPANNVDVALTPVEACLDLSARAKTGKVQLVWQPRPGTDRYDVYRTEASNPDGLSKIAETTSTYATYLDGSAVDETSYLYRVTAVSAASSCNSQLVSARPSGDRPPTAESPAILSSPVTRAFSGGAYRYDVEATDPNGDVLSYRLLSGPAGMGIDAQTGLLSWLPGDAQLGSHAVEIEVDDGSGGVATQSFDVNVENLSNDPPSITSAPLTGATQGELYAYPAAATDPDPGDTLRFFLAYAPPGMRVDPISGEVAWTPGDVQVGTLEVRLGVRDAGGLEGFQTFSVSVADASDAPVLGRVGMPDAYAGEPYQYQVPALDPDEGDTVSFALLVGPVGMTIDPVTGVIDWAPDFTQLGEHPVTLRVVDAVGLEDVYVTSILVSPPGSAPSIHSTPPTRVRWNGFYSYHVEATDPDPGDTLTYSLDQAPRGMTMESFSGLIRWLRADLGIYPVTVRVTDSVGLFALQSYDLTVSFTGGPPFITSSPVTEAEAEQPYVYEVQAFHPEGAGFVFTLDNAPDGMTIGGISGEILWTPELDQIGTRWVAVHVTDLGGLTAEQIFPIEVSGDASLVDDDGDGFTELDGDCDDANPFAYPGGHDAPANGFDEDCSGADAELGEGAFFPLSAYPGLIGIDAPTEVRFSSIFAGQGTPPDELILEEIDEFSNPVRTLGALRDDGTAGDLTAGDLIFGGSFELVSSVEGALQFRAHGVLPDSGESVETGAFAVPVTRFPTDVVTTPYVEPVEDSDTEARMAADRVIVAFRPGTPPDTVETIVGDLGGTVLGLFAATGSYEVGIPVATTAQEVYEAIARLTNRREVLRAEPAYLGEITAALQLEDPLYSTDGDQWHLPQVRADEAWVLTRGAGIKIAVADTGVNYQHEDLRDQVVRGLDGSVIGHDFLSTTPASVRWEPMDGNGHGTRVAGIIAASHNGMGGVGVAWESKILPIRVCERRGTRVGCEYTAIIRAVDFAAVHNARIINLSLGGPHSEDLEKAILGAAARGVLIIASAGNDATDERHYPAAYSSVMGVMATTTTDDEEAEIRSSFSNFGSWVDIGAPGSDILSTMINADPAEDYGGETPVDGNDDYGYADGTSFAAPVVAGAAALLWAEADNRGWTAQRVRQHLLDTATPVWDIAPPPYHFGIIGFKRLDVFEALFNGSFEPHESFAGHGGLAGWTTAGGGFGTPDVEARGDFFDLAAPFLRNGHDKGMVVLGNRNRDGEYASSFIWREFELEPDVQSFGIIFDIRFFTEEYPRFVDAQGGEAGLSGCFYPDNYQVNLEYDDFRAILDAGGKTLPIGDELVTFFYPPLTSRDFSGFSTFETHRCGGQDIPADGTIGDTGWYWVRSDPPLPGSNEPVELLISLFDTPVFGGNGPFPVDSFLLIDNIRFDDITLEPLPLILGRASPEPSEETEPPPPSCGLLGIEALVVPLLAGALGELRRRRRLRLQGRR